MVGNAGDDASASARATTTDGDERAAGAGFNRRDETTRRTRTSADVGAANVAIALAPAPTRRARGSAPRSDDADLYTCRTIGMMRFEDDVGGGTASTVGVFRRASGPLCLFALVR